MEIDDLKKQSALSSLGRGKKRQQALIIAELRHRYPLKDLLKLSDIVRSAFYYYLKSKDVVNTKKLGLIYLISLIKTKADTAIEAFYLYSDKKDM